jgi:RluA family pseudouridine synthase
MPSLLELLYHGHQIIAVNKPVGLLSQPSRQTAETVVSATLALLARQGRAQRELLLVHRLDRDTSGVLLMATSKASCAYLATEFRAHRVAKTYIAICQGLTTRHEFTEQAPLARFDPHAGKVFVDHRSGRTAETAVRVLAAHAAHGVSLVLCRPTTGRTHQIRVHLAMNGLPLVGDQLYGDPGHASSSLGPSAAPLHHLLHAHSLTFMPAPNQPALYLKAPLQPAFAAFLSKAGLASAFAKLL